MNVAVSDLGVMVRPVWARMAFVRGRLDADLGHAAKYLSCTTDIENIEDSAHRDGDNNTSYE